MSEILSNVSDAIHNLQSNPQFLDQQINVYTTSIYTTLQIQKKVRLLIDFLEAHQIDFKKIDMCYDLEARPRMIELLPEELKENAAEILAPVIFAGDFEYCGNFDDFMQAREMDLIYTFFKLTPPEGTSEYIRAFPEPSEVSVEDTPETEPEPETNPEPEEPKEYDPEVIMGEGNFEDTEMFAAVMDQQPAEQKIEQTTEVEVEQTISEEPEQVVQEQVEEEDVIELSVSASQPNDSENEEVEEFQEQDQDQEQDQQTEFIQGQELEEQQIE